MQASRWLFLGMVLCAGCSSSGGDNADASYSPLTCDWLAADNCWKSTVNLATTCLPPADEFGMLNAANTICTYTNGTTVTFDTPLSLPIPADMPPPFKFTVTTGGQTCLRFDETTTGFTVTAGGQTFALTLVQEPGVRVTCDDGTIYSAPNFFDLLTCSGGSMGVPGTSWFSNLVSVTFDLKGAATATQLLPIFDCRRP